ncbi:DUF4013 domain-containing protein [Methanobrevibacter arboriphilus]|uniref:DUF4013 domain-containing protein n=1 Tax=Methanobrevibacter arboriphilus TaxID=39441 RepID=UPI000ACC5572|nr:DUF4013 domain-containing protein [Methanobrevibacter arboriphilus]
MKIVEIFKDGLTYPSNNWQNVLILGLLTIIANIVLVIPAIGISLNSIGFTGIVLTIVSIISFIINLIIMGYSFSIIKNTVNNIDTIPSFEIGNNILNGLKILIISIVYYIIPVIITILVAIASGAFNNLAQIIALSGGAISDELAFNLFASFFAVMIVGIILFIITTLIITIGIARFAEKGNMGAAFKFGEIFNTIKKNWMGKLYCMVYFIVHNIIYCCIYYGNNQFNTIYRIYNYFISYQPISCYVLFKSNWINL